jgi:hypothetical protein
VTSTTCDIARTYLDAGFPARFGAYLSPMSDQAGSRIEFELLRGGEVVRVIRTSSPNITIGRDLSNTVVLLDEDVSCNHAVVSVGPDGPRLRDLRSTNGTFLNDERVAGEAPLADGDTLRLGERCTLRVRQVGQESGAALALADLTAGTIHRIEGTRCLIGSGPACQVEIPGGPRFAASLELGPGEVWLDAEGQSRAIDVGATFEVAGHTFRLEALERMSIRITLSGTVTASPSYALSVALDAPGGPVAQLSDPRGTIQHTVAAENRATLLYVLGRRRKEDLDKGEPEPMAGWIDDEDVLIAVWGRAALHQATSNWSVLLHRLRRELDEAGFDPSIIEKRRGAVRLRLRNIEIGGLTSAA